MQVELIDALGRWVEHSASNPDTIRVLVQELKRPSGLQEMDASRALLADVVQCVGQLIEGTPP